MSGAAPDEGIERRKLSATPTKKSNGASKRSLDEETSAALFRAGMFSVLNPLAAIVWGRIFLSEPITANKIIGAALILFGILLPNLVKRRSAENTHIMP